MKRLSVNDASKADAKTVMDYALSPNPVFEYLKMSDRMSAIESSDDMARRGISLEVIAQRDRLYNAAPVLLAALKDLVDHQCPKNLSDLVSAREKVNHWKAARAAIAKAEPR